MCYVFSVYYYMFNYVLNKYLIYFYLIIYVLIMYCIFNQIGKYHVKDMNVYIEPLINELLELWSCNTMYDISRPTNAQRDF